MKEFELQKKLGITTKKTEDLVKRFEELSNSEKFQINQMVELTFNSCGIEGNTLSKTETFVICLYHHFNELDEDQGLFILMEEADRNDTVSREEIMKQLQSIKKPRKKKGKS